MNDRGLDSDIDTTVHGAVVDEQTRCVHWHGPTDVIAIRFACCDRFYPCRECHDEDAEHAAAVWPLDQRNTPAVLCGVCRSVLTIAEYLPVDGCPRCGAAFNPGCRLHTHLYFQTDEGSAATAPSRA